jgi:hypothetical protein
MKASAKTPKHPKALDQDGAVSVKGCVTIQSFQCCPAIWEAVIPACIIHHSECNVMNAVCKIMVS